MVRVLLPIRLPLLVDESEQISCLFVWRLILFPMVSRQGSVFFGNGVFSMIENLMAKVKEKKCLIGTHITANDSQQTEIIGNVGFDYLWIDLEHTAIDKYCLLQHLIAARSAGMPCFVRIPWNDPVLAKPVLEMGVQGIIFPLVETVEEAELAVKSCLYPPDGIRGFGPRRATRYGLDSVQDYIHASSKKILKLVQIETRPAFENVDKIARIPGVDIVILGPNDLSGAFGKLAQINDPEIQEIYRTVIRKTHEAGKPLLVSTGDFSRASIKMWAEMGADFITVGSEMGYIVQGARTTLTNAREIFAELRK